MSKKYSTSHQFLALQEIKIVKIEIVIPEKIFCQK